MAVFRGLRPDITPAQIAGVLMAGVPVVSNLFHAFGVFTVTPQEQAALNDAVTWGSVSSGVLIGSDAALRIGRNHAQARAQQQQQPLALSQVRTESSMAGPTIIKTTWTQKPMAPNHPDVPTAPSGEVPPSGSLSGSASQSGGGARPNENVGPPAPTEPLGPSGPQSPQGAPGVGA